MAKQFFTNYVPISSEKQQLNIKIQDWNENNERLIIKIIIRSISLT